MTTRLDTGRVLIRPATAADRAILVEFRLAMLAELAGHDPGAGTLQPAESAAMREANERWIEDHLERDFEAWLADLDGRPVASAGLLWFAHPPGPINPGGVEAYILNVYTRPEARRLGLARALVERLVEEARAAGVRRIWLRASSDGRPLYEAMGFRTGDYLQLTLD
ncbi:MAG: GNAT family N-acetyltransferase [Candidatus Limnocylindrales bacterium]|jgi:GNAT superfamily N-acetyltransferase